MGQGGVGTGLCLIHLGSQWQTAWQCLPALREPRAGVQAAAGALACRASQSGPLTPLRAPPHLVSCLPSLLRAPPRPVSCLPSPPEPLPAPSPASPVQPTVTRSCVPAKLTCSLRTVASLHRCRFWEAPPDLTRWRWRPLRVCRPLLPRPSTLRMPPGSSLAKDLEAAPLWGAGPRPQLHLLRGNLSTLGRPHPLPTPGVPWTAQPLRGPWLLCKRSVPGRMPVRAEGLVVTQWDS